MARNPFGFPMLSIPLLLALFVVVVEARRKPKALFVFGDSYVDTGNFNKSNPSQTIPWNLPYGKTFPGQPTGRFSDGDVLTDFIAKVLKVPSPVTYRESKEKGHRDGDGGINFAFSGAGVFPTFGPDIVPVGAQIGQLEELVRSRTYKRHFLAHSLAIVVIAGNDYNSFIVNNKGNEAIELFVPKVVKELGANVERLYRLGFRHVALNLVEPFGCLPLTTQLNNFTACVPTSNDLSTLHNDFLVEKVALLLCRFKKLKIVTLDLFSTFSSVLQNGGDNDLLRPCCIGTIKGAICGSVDPTTGLPLFTVCKDPNRSFFWDGTHPTNKGWTLVVRRLRNSIKSLAHMLP